MFEKVSQVAEQVATNVSRRAFLGKLGQGALVFAGVLGAGLGFPAPAKAARKRRCCYRCYPREGEPFRTCHEQDGPCSAGGGTCDLIGEVHNCRQCWDLI